MREGIVELIGRGADLAARVVKCSNYARRDINESMNGFLRSYSPNVVYCGIEKLDPAICVVEKIIGEDKVPGVG